MFIQEKSKIEDQLRQSLTSFKQKALDTKETAVATTKVMPTINRRLGGGLAAVVAMKM